MRDLAFILKEARQSAIHRAEGDFTIRGHVIVNDQGQVLSRKTGDWSSEFGEALEVSPGEHAEELAGIVGGTVVAPQDARRKVLARIDQMLAGYSTRCEAGDGC